ncbi:MAG TPA: hypothetical protein VLJ59_12765 [Mycobacteriales bacterium]|nr:hypothetical protein [Mycobacteriales bacterium]
MTRQSGKSKTVHARFVHNNRLVDALHMQAGVAILHDPDTALLGTAYVETDLGQACSVGLDALRLAEAFQPVRVLHYIRDVRGRLRERHGNDPLVEQLAEQTMELLGAG